MPAPHPVQRLPGTFAPRHVSRLEVFGSLGRFFPPRSEGRWNHGRAVFARPHLVEALEGLGEAEAEAVGDFLVGHLENHLGVPLGEDAGHGTGMSSGNEHREPPPSTGQSPCTKSCATPKRPWLSIPGPFPAIPDTNAPGETLLSAAARGEQRPHPPFPAKDGDFGVGDAWKFPLFPRKPRTGSCWPRSR